MRKFALIPLLMLTLLFVPRSSAQVTDLIVQLDLGIGGGVSSPTGKLNDIDNVGYNGIAKARLHGIIPLNITGMAMYNRLPNKTGGESDQQWMFGAGLEYGLLSVAVHPYLAADVFYTSFTNTAAGSFTTSRGGVGLGAGAILGLPGTGGLDFAIKYQMMNVFGHESGEETISQISANVAIMFSVL